MPTETMLLRWLRTLCPQTLHDLNDRVVQLAVQAKVTSGRKLRLDATCVQTEIHHPGGSGLLVDSVWVLSRIVKRAKGLVKDQVSYLQQTCRSHLRTARKTAQTLHRQLRRKGEEKEAEQKQLYQKLIETAEQMVRPATRVVGALSQQSEPQPHTRAIPRAYWRGTGGVRSSCDSRTRVDGGIVTRYEILSHPNEHGQAIAAVQHHRKVFAHPPGLVAGDRGVHSPETETTLAAVGVKRVAIPGSGKLSEERRALEHSRPWRPGYRWRADTLGRIASLRRDDGWSKSAYHGQEGMERWLGLGVIATNLRHIAGATLA